MAAREGYRECRKLLNGTPVQVPETIVPRMQGTLLVEDLHFSVPGRKTPVLKGLSAARATRSAATSCLRPWTPLCSAMRWR